MKRALWFALGAVFFAACGTAEIKFPYKFFHASPINVWEYPNGQLLGARPSEHRQLRECKPVRKNAEGKLIQECVVVFYSELNRLVADYKKTKQELIDCQRGGK